MKKILLLNAVLLLISAPLFSQGNHQSGPCDAITWEQELNKINWLVLKASSLNVIHGLYLNSSQAMNLMHLAKKIESLQIFTPIPEECVCSELSEIHLTYRSLLEYLQYKKKVPKELQKEVNKIRIKQSELVKKTIIGAQKPGYMANNCLQCHAMPHQYSQVDVFREQANPISEDERRKIDRTHIEGIFGVQGLIKLWALKSEVNRILTNSQKFVLRDFRCCLLPPDGPANAANFGQVFVTNKWNSYLKEIRGLSKDQWRDFRPLYFVPLSDYIEATLPGIRQRDKKAMLDNISDIIEESRELDLVDYELQKDSLCMRLKKQLSVDRLTGQKQRLDEDKQFIMAMFLLFPGSAEVYEQIVREGERTQLGYRME